MPLIIISRRKNKVKILVGYNKNGATQKWLIHSQKDGKYVCSKVTIMTNLYGEKYLATEKRIVRSDIVDIHEEEI